MLNVPVGCLHQSVADETGRGWSLIDVFPRGLRKTIHEETVGRCSWLLIWDTESYIDPPSFQTSSAVAALAAAAAPTAVAAAAADTAEAHATVRPAAAAAEMTAATATTYEIKKAKKKTSARNAEPTRIDQTQKQHKREIKSFALHELQIVTNLLPWLILHLRRPPTALGTPNRLAWMILHPKRPPTALGTPNRLA